MYADRRHRSSGIDPRSLTVAVLLNGAIVTALLLSNPVLTIVHRDHPLTTYPIALQPPPEPLPPPRTPAQPQPAHQTISVPQPPIEVVTALPPLDTTLVTPRPLPSATGPAVVPEATPTPALVTLAPEIDRAHRGDLQPTYPAAELRAEREGVVVVRVLVGVDGRVHQVEPVSATSDAFFRATQEQALRRWRFHAATRGSVPVEAWRQMTIRFVIPR